MFGRRAANDQPAGSSVSRPQNGVPYRDDKPTSPGQSIKTVASAAGQGDALPTRGGLEPSAPVNGSSINVDGRTDDFYAIKMSVFNALVETVDLSRLAQMDPDTGRSEIREIVTEIISIKNVVMSISEQEQLLTDLCNDIFGYGPLEPLLARDDIADIMVNGAQRVFIEVGGKVERTNIRFRDNTQLMNICQRIVSKVGRRVDESSPICDARLADGSRVNVIAPPLAIDGPTLTIRKFRKDKLKLDGPRQFRIDHAGWCAHSSRSLGGHAAM